MAYSKGDFKTALSRFIEAITINPACAGSVRLALACCCFKLEEYDRTKAALDKAFEIDVCYCLPPITISCDFISSV